MGVYKQGFASSEQTNPLLRRFSWATDEDTSHPAWVLWLQFSPQLTQRSWRLYKANYEE